MSLDSFKKKAKNAIKAAALGGTLMAGAPAAAEAQKLPPVLTDFIKQNESTLRAIASDAARITQEGKRVMEEGRKQFEQIEQQARIFANSPEAQKLIQDSQQFVAESKRRLQESAHSPETKALINAGKQQLSDIKTEAEDIARKNAAELKRIADEFNRVDRE